MNNLSLESFYIHAPIKSGTKSNKLMIVMHGLGDSLESYKTFVKEINVTGLNYLLLNAPKRYYFGYSWYDIAPGNPHIGIVNSVKTIQDILIKITTETEFKMEDIFICGFSQGAAISMETFYQINKKLAGIICLSPRLYPNRIPETFNEAQINTPVFMAHGEFDEVINFKETKQIYDERISSLNLAKFHSFEMGHEIDPFEILALRNWLNEYL